MHPLGGIAFTEAIAEIDRLRLAPAGREAIAGMLEEQSNLYAGRSTGEAERLRGIVLASLETVGLPSSAMKFVIEELENGYNPFVVAAAAKALRGAASPPPSVVPLLLRAIERLRGSDDVVCFNPREAKGAEAEPSTALTELFATLAWLGPRAHEAEVPLAAMLERKPSVFSAQVRVAIERALAAITSGSRPAGASCCSIEPAPLSFAPAVKAPRLDVDIASVELQDQDGSMFSYRDFFSGRPSVLTFFYSRCMNPNKCSLTITKLGRLQKLVDGEGSRGRFNIAAVTYDPAFDSADRLRAYGADRGMSFDDRNRILRTTGPFEPFQRWLDLGVGYGSTTVNQHRLDTVILDRTGYPCASIARRQWDEAEILVTLTSQL